MRIELDVKPGRPAFGAAQGKMLDGVVADRAEPERILHCAVDRIEREGLEQSQNLHELPLAGGAAVLAAQPGLKQPTQGCECLGQVPALKWRRLVQGANLLLQQSEVVQRVEDEVGGLVGPTVPRDLFRADRDDDFVDIALHQHLAVRMSDRH